MSDKRTADERREYLRAYRARPENKAKERLRSLNRMRDKLSTPEGREKENQYQREYRARNWKKQAEYQARYNEKNRDKRLQSYKNSSFKKRYGITTEERDELFSSQGFACRACGTTALRSKKYWHVDHCHTTGKVRGILCPNCNIALGQVNDSVEHLQKLITYLEGNR